MMAERTWARDPEAEDPYLRHGWASRVYRSDDGWTAERYYVPGDRGLVRPTTVWELTRTGVSGWGSGGGFRTLAEAKAWPDSDDGRAYLARVKGAEG